MAPASEATVPANVGGLVLDARCAGSETTPFDLLTADGEPVETQRTTKAGRTVLTPVTPLTAGARYRLDWKGQFESDGLAQSAFFTAAAAAPPPTSLGELTYEVKRGELQDTGNSCGPSWTETPGGKSLVITLKWKPSADIAPWVAVTRLEAKLTGTSTEPATYPSGDPSSIAATLAGATEMTLNVACSPSGSGKLHVTGIVAEEAGTVAPYDADIDIGCTDPNAPPPGTQPDDNSTDGTGSSSSSSCAVTTTHASSRAAGVTGLLVGIAAAMTVARRRRRR